MTKPEERDDQEWQRILSPDQYRVLRQRGTERPFSGTLCDNKEPGTYRCAGCGETLFVSNAKFDSGTGWPSFFEPAGASRLRLEDDFELGMKRIEVLCASCGGHLGHVFDDGPKPTGKRYCINSVALQFEPSEGG